MFHLTCHSSKECDRHIIPVCSKTLIIQLSNCQSKAVPLHLSAYRWVTKSREQQHMNVYHSSSYYRWTDLQMICQMERIIMHRKSHVEIYICLLSHIAHLTAINTIELAAFFWLSKYPNGLTKQFHVNSNWGNEALMTQQTCATGIVRLYCRSMPITWNRILVRSWV